MVLHSTHSYKLSISFLKVIIREKSEPQGSTDMRTWEESLLPSATSKRPVSILEIVLETFSSMLSSVFTDQRASEHQGRGKSRLSSMPLKSAYARFMT